MYVYVLLISLNLGQRFVYKREIIFSEKKEEERGGKEGGKRGERGGKEGGKREGGEKERFVLD